MPDWADRFEGDRRPRHQPGTNFQYGDVRVNVAALALLHVWRRRALPSAPETAFYASGGSSNRLYVDPENDLVIAVRWIDGIALRRGRRARARQSSLIVAARSSSCATSL